MLSITAITKFMGKVDSLPFMGKRVWLDGLLPIHYVSLTVIRHTSLHVKVSASSSSCFGLFRVGIDIWVVFYLPQYEEDDDDGT